MKISKLHYVVGEDGLMYVHCNKCIKELPEGMSPAEFADLEIVIIQGHYLGVGCKRHSIPVVIFDISEQLTQADIICEECGGKHLSEIPSMHESKKGH